MFRNIVSRMEFLYSTVSSLNSSKFFAGMVMIMMNIGSKHITIKLTKSQEEFLKNHVGHQLLVFAISWLGTRDIFMALLLTLIFVFVTRFICNENSSFCVMPEGFKNLSEVEKAADLNKDGVVSDDEINRAIAILEKAKHQNKMQEKMTNLRAFASMVL